MFVLLESESMKARVWLKFDTTFQWIYDPTRSYYAGKVPFWMGLA